MIVSFACQRCHARFDVFQGEEVPSCCGQLAQCVSGSATASVREVVDTGLMARKLEVVAGVVELQRNRDKLATIK